MGEKTGTKLYNQLNIRIREVINGRSKFYLMHTTITMNIVSLDNRGFREVRFG